MSNIAKYMNQIKAAFPNAHEIDVYTIGKSTFEKVGQFLTDRSAIRQGAYSQISVANEALSFDDAINSTGVEELTAMVKSCGIADCYVAPCCESILNIMDRCLNKPATAAWADQNRKNNTVNNNGLVSNPLSDIYASDTVNILNSTVAPGQEAFGVNVDLAVPDLKVAITISIMNFHTRLLPRILPTKSINQPSIQYKKEFLEVYDLADMDVPRKRLVDLYKEPQFAANELKRIIPLVKNDVDEGGHTNFLSNEIEVVDPESGNNVVIDGVLKFGLKSNILKLALDPTKYGYSKMNRTDLVAEGVKLESVYVRITNGEGANASSSIVRVDVPLAQQRLTRMVNADDSAMRNADIKFRKVLTSSAVDVKGAAVSALEGIIVESTDPALAGNNVSVVLDLNLKPTISLKFGDADCLGSVGIRLRHATDNRQLTAEQNTAFAAVKAELLGYVLDARFSEENLRKTSIAVWTHNQTYQYDIPIGRNYVFDYAMGQENADENAVNLNKVIGIGQDDVSLRNILIRTLEDVYDRLQPISGGNPVDQIDYVGTKYVAGDKVKPTVFMGKLDFRNLNVIRDSDRSGDIKQKAITFLNAATTKVVAESLILHQLNGAGVTFRCVTTMPVLGNILAQPHIHNHMDKEDARDIGDGVEYVLVLPNGVRLEIVTTTFNYMANRIVMWPIIKNNTESELNYAINWDYGTMVAHYTPSGEEAHHRMFANIRELPIVTNPVGLIIDIEGMKEVGDIAEDFTLRPTMEITGSVVNEGSVNVTGSVTTTQP